MKKIDQEFIHDPENGVIGDCMRACIASVFELNREDVPHFGAMPDETWLKDYVRWLHKHGWAIFTRHAVTDTHPEIQEDENPYYFAIGRTPRDPEVTHMVVCRDGKVVHDPHPSRAGLQSIEAFEIIFRL
jgi:hypothetical protein